MQHVLSRMKVNSWIVEIRVRASCASILPCTLRSLRYWSLVSYLNSGLRFIREMFIHERCESSPPTFFFCLISRCSLNCTCRRLFVLMSVSLLKQRPDDNSTMSWCSVKYLSRSIHSWAGKSHKMLWHHEGGSGLCNTLAQAKQK